MKKILTFFLFSIIFISNINFSYSIEPDVFIQTTVNRAADTLSNNLSKEERIEELKQIAIETVDINGIGLYSLGSYRKNLNILKPGDIVRASRWFVDFQIFF